MKNIISIIAFGSLLFIVGACNKIDKSKTSTVSFTMNGISWRSDKMDYSWASETKFNFNYGKGIHNGSNVDGTEGFDERITLYFAKKKMGKQFVNSLSYNNMGTLNEESSPLIAYFNTTTDEGCVGCEDFIVDSTNTADNWIEITKQEKNYRKIWGKFNLTMIKESSGCDRPRYSDTIRIQNAEFYLEL